MPRTVSPSEIHSEKALDYKQKMRDEIMGDLETNISIYSRTVSKDAREHIKDTVAKNIDAKIAEFEQAYLKMRTQRGEKITIQDMDDIMPYVRLAMLKELHIQIADKNSEGAQKLAGEIVKLEGEIKEAKVKVKTLRGELDAASAGVADTLKSLTKTPEYVALEKANQSLGKNTGTINAWREVQKMADKGLDTTTIKKELGVLKSNAIKDQTKAIETYQMLKEIQDDNSAGLIDEASADIYIIRIDALINTLDTNRFTQLELEDQLKNYIKALGQVKTLTDLGAVDAINFAEAINYSSGIGVGAVAEIEAIEEAEKLFASLDGDREKFKDAINTKKVAAESKKPGLEKNLREAKAGFEKKVSALQPLIDAERAAARKLGRKQGEKKNLEKQKKSKAGEKRLLEIDSEIAQDVRAGKEKLKASEDASQKIRINARNLIVRSGPSKASEYLRTPDNKKAIMLQPGEIVTPILDENGNIETTVDGPRDYTHVILADGTIGWIALSDKLGGKFKQEYVDINLRDNKIDTSKSYVLRGEDVRLRTGFSTRADTIDILDSKKVDHIHLIANPSEGDNAPEGSGLTWKMVEVAYRDGTTKTGYIAEKYLAEKVEAPTPNIPISSEEKLTPRPPILTAKPISSNQNAVISPYAPYNVVDITGKNPGDFVVDQSTQKLFIVPERSTPSQSPAPKVEKSGEGPNRPMGEEPVSSLVKKLFENVPPSPVAPENDIPYGIAVPDRPGLVNSPYAGKYQLVDVTGLSVGQEVKCPYSGKLFRVPPYTPPEPPKAKE